MQNLSSKSWSFQLFYWDYAVGILLLALALAFTVGSMGTDGRGFLNDLAQAEPYWLGSAFIGGVIFNLANLLLVAAIDIAGLAVAFPVGIGLALALGVITTYWATPVGNVEMLAIGVIAILIAVILDAIAYKKLASGMQKTPMKGIVLSLTAGGMLGFFYSFVARSMGTIDPVSHSLEAGKLGPYTAVVFFSVGIFLSNFVWNTIVMYKPFAGEPVSYADYFRKGTVRLHLIGIVGGVIWSIGMALSILANNAAGPALSYGLGQGATLIGALWGVFVWKEFKAAPPGTNKILGAMFLFYILGLGVLIFSKA